MPTNKEIFEQKMNALADAINTKAGLTGKKNLDDLKDAVDGISVGGDQPTLFAPVVTGGVNSISWENNPDNGAFGTVVGTIDGNVVTSPLTITQAMDGKTLVLTASETDFLDAVTSIPISYIDASPLFAAFSDGTATYGFVLATSGGSFGFYDGTSVIQTGYLRCCSQGTTPKTSNYYLNINTDSISFRKIINGVADGFDMVTGAGSGNHDASVALTLENIDTHNQYSFSLTSSEQGKSIDYVVPRGNYTLIANILK